jgi:hypothetical protein
LALNWEQRGATGRRCLAPPLLELPVPTDDNRVACAVSGTLRISLLVCCLAVAVQIGFMAADVQTYQWDFHSYYYASRAWLSGLNPYDTASYQTLAEPTSPHRAEFQPFLYPPYALPLFSILGAVPYGVAYLVYLAIKVVSIGLLFALSLEVLGPHGGAGLFPWVALVGFSGALLFDMRSGNVSTFEAVFLILAARAFARGKWMKYAFWVIPAGLFKIVNLALLGLLLPPGTRKRSQAIALGLCIPTGLFACGWALSPNMTREFLHSVSLIAPYRGPVDSSVVAIVRDLEILIHGSSQREMVTAIWAICAILGLGLSAWRVKSILRSGKESMRYLTACFAIVTLAVFAPRLIKYTFTALLLPVVYLLYCWPWRRLRAAVLMGCMLPVQYLLRYVMGKPESGVPRAFWLLPLEYWNWLLVLATWGGTLILLDRNRRPLGVYAPHEIPSRRGSASHGGAEKAGDAMGQGAGRGCQTGGRSGRLALQTRAQEDVA